MGGGTPYQHEHAGGRAGRRAGSCRMLGARMKMLAVTETPSEPDEQYTRDALSREAGSGGWLRRRWWWWWCWEGGTVVKGWT